MLNDYKDRQSLAYNLFINDILNNCVTHAYLIDENNYSDSFLMVMAFVKAILCNDNYLDNSKCNNCSLCNRIDCGNYSELKIISPDGMFIKKGQITSLQHDFSRGAVEGKKRIYIIRDCDKMRPEAANSMLKFLEEPDGDILAILMTNNINNVLSTIVSRCKVIKFNNFMENDIDLTDELSNLAINFVNNLENMGIDMIVSVKDLWFSIVSNKDRDKMVIVFDKMIDIYYDVMMVITGGNSIKCNIWKDDIYKIANNNRLDEILNKINILLDKKDSIKFNVNSNLLIDSLIVSIGGVNSDSRY